MSSTKRNKRKRFILIIEQKLEICDKIKQKVSYAEIMGLYNITTPTRLSAIFAYPNGFQIYLGGGVRINGSLLYTSGG